MKRALPLALLSFATHASAAHELDAVFGRAVTISSKGNVTTVAYCPDNTCEVFGLKGKESAGPVQDFAFVYLFAYSGYAYLQGFQSKPPAPPVLSVLGRYREICSQEAPMEAAKCVVSALAKRYDIQAHFVRFDEGKKNSMWS